MAAITALVAGVLTATVAVAPRASADDVTASQDTLRTGWDQSEPALSPAAVSSSDFGQLFATQLQGQVYAQPVVVGSTVVAVTENNWVYGLNADTGAVLWSDQVGTPWPVATIGCGDLTPNIGITSTPVYDPATGAVYFTSLLDQPSPTDPTWEMQAVKVSDGSELPGFPTAIGGSPTNDPSASFESEWVLQRPGLLLLNGVVYAGFGSHCDMGTYTGYVAGVNATTGAQTTLWATESNAGNVGAGVWQAGGGLVSDGSGQILLATGNGVSPPPGIGTAQPAPGNLAESVVRLQVGSDGALTPTDYFSPSNNTNLDRDDTDLGSGGPMAIPAGYGTSSYPDLLVEVGKDGRIFLLDRDNLGGSVAAGTPDRVLQTLTGNGVWGHPAFFGTGSTGYVYIISNSGPLTVYQLGATAGGVPQLTKVAATTSTWGYTSGSPVVTSNGTDPSSALVWAVYSTGSTGAGGQLRAYPAVPGGPTMSPVYSASIGTAAKFAIPATSNGRVYVGTRDGVLYGFGAPTAQPLSGTTTNFGAVATGSAATEPVTVTATRQVTISSVAATGPYGVSTSATGPVTLQAGQTATVNVTFTPAGTGEQTGELQFGTGEGTTSFGLTGTGTAPGLTVSTGSIDFGSVPTGGNESDGVEVTDSGTTSETITGVTNTTGDFTTTGLPQVGDVLQPGQSIAVTVTYTPTMTGAEAASFTIESNASAGNSITVALNGTGITGQALLSVSPPSLAFGDVPVGQTVTGEFSLTDTGNLGLVVEKAAPPSGAFWTSAPLSEGQPFAPGDEYTQTVSFTPPSAGNFSGVYEVTANDGQGPHYIELTGTGVGPATAPAAPTPTTSVRVAPLSAWHRNGSAVRSGSSVRLTAGRGSFGSAVMPVAVPTSGLRVSFKVSLTGGGGADGLALALLNPAIYGSTALGRNGRAAGLPGIQGVAVDLLSAHDAADRAADVLGVSDGWHSGPGYQLQMLGLMHEPDWLHGGTHVVTVQVVTGGLLVRIDRGRTLFVRVHVPAEARLAFFGGTVGRHAQTVSAVSVGWPRG